VIALDMIMILKRSLLLPLSIFLVAALTLLGTLLLLVPEPQQQARVPIGGPFKLTSHEGKPFTEADLKGKPFLVFFGFTHCPEVCPTTLHDLSQDLESLGAGADKLRVAFITVDPARDTPELLKTYLSSFDPRIVGLTGTEEGAHRLGLHHGPFGGGVPHGRQGRLRGHLQLPGSAGCAAGEAEETRQSKLECR
jgi:cytochrome oxidase Cu insertion factor (SCO1/SenC/PrrC family)